MALQTSAAAKSAAEASTPVLSRQHPCKIASKPAKLQQQVQLPSIFTMQVISSVILLLLPYCNLLLPDSSTVCNSMLQTSTDNMTATCSAQGVSANTSCFNSLSYKTSDNRRVHGLVQSPKHVKETSLYLEDFVTLLKSNT